MSLHLLINFKRPAVTATTVSIRPIKKCDWLLFNELLSNSNAKLNEYPATFNETVLDNKALEFESSIREAFETACPLSKVKQYQTSASEEAVALIKLKRQARRKAQKDPAYKTIYRNLQRQVKSLLDKESSLAWKSATEELNEHDGSKFWKTFNRLTGTGKSSKRVPNLSIDGIGKTNCPTEVANAFANSLLDIHQTPEDSLFDKDFKKHVEAVIEQKRDFFSPIFSTFADCGVAEVPSEKDVVDCALTDPIDLEEINSAIKKCKGKSAPGPDGISFAVLKKLPENTLLALSLLFNHCLAFGYFPRRWKQANGIMLTKPGKDATLAKNYRTISLLAATGKLFERILNARLMCHLQQEKFFNDWQRGYLPGKHSSEILFRLTEEIEYSKNSRRSSWHTTVVSLDVEKAFDAVWHDGLRYKLMQIGLPPGICRILSSFLSERTVTVKIRDTLSKPVPLRAGTPQGSVLSPLLYIIYVNDAPLGVSNGARAGQYADDITAWATSKGPKISQFQIQKTLSAIEKWCSLWHIKMNAGKTQLVTFKRGPSKSCDLKFFNNQLSEAKSIKVLGVTLGKSNQFLEHCKNKATIANQRTRLLKMLRGRRWGANKKVLLRLYKQYIRPILEYGAVCFRDKDRNSSRHLALAERRALRVALGVGMRTPLTDLYEQAGIQPLEERMQDLRERAISKFDKNSKGLKDLAILKEIMVVQPH